MDSPKRFRRASKLFLILVAAVFSVNAVIHAAQPLPCPSAPAAGSVLALAQTIDIALCNNPRTRQSWIAAKVSATQAELARVPYRPQVTGNAGLDRSETRNVSNPGGATDLSAVLTLSYLLLDFGGREAGLRQAQEALTAANWTHSATVQTVILGAVTAYYQLAGASEALQSARAAEQSSMQNLEVARARLKAGTATRADVLQAQTANSQDRLNRVQSEGDLANAQGVLASALGVPVDLDLKVVASRDFGAGEVAEQNVPSLLAMAKQQRPDLAAAQAQIRAARENVRIQESAGRPVLSLSGSLGATQSAPGSDPRTGAVGLSLSVPLYTGKRTAYQKLLAEQQLEAQIAATDRLGQDAALEVWRAYQDLRTQRQSVMSAEDLASSAQESYNVALGRYKSGVGTVTDLLNAQATLANANQQDIQARYRWNLAKSSLARALGILDRSMFDTANTR
ncbi:MAG: TolC family protein [Betaproteobacteria bacterium]|nr:TolC family protein [Betaproteobacteria bacterium]